jgi:IS5 family transposase
MLRVYFLQLWFNLSDRAVEEALYDSVAMRDFAGIDLGQEGAPDETTACKFHHLLERHRWGQRVDAAIKAKNRYKSSVRSKVEHTIGVIKRFFGFQKVRYRGLAKNLHRLEMTAALVNLFMVKRRLLAV